MPSKKAASKPATHAPDQTLVDCIKYVTNGEVPIDEAARKYLTSLLLTVKECIRQARSSLDYGDVKMAQHMAAVAVLTPKYSNAEIKKTGVQGYGNGMVLLSGAADPIPAQSLKLETLIGCVMTLTDQAVKALEKGSVEDAKESLHSAYDLAQHGAP